MWGMKPSIARFNASKLPRLTLDMSQKEIDEPVAARVIEGLENSTVEGAVS
jgi:hypothetical protein